jgi:hypothetical protein
MVNSDSFENGENAENAEPQPNSSDPSIEGNSIDGQSDGSADEIVAEIVGDLAENPVDPASLDTPVLASVDQSEPRVTKSDVASYLKKPTAIAGVARHASRRTVIDLDQELSNLSATGGAVGGFVLGLWSIVCSLITYFGFINAGLAILLGIYGLSSSRKRLAMVGILLGVCGLMMSLMEINEIVGDYLLNQQETGENF